tara:strand:- start:10784 stop:11572 length:789 start_codon:yes stop_codon:yes gene_type:complete
MKIRVLVTGAFGQLGKTIEDFYADSQNKIDFTFVSKATLDISNKEALLTFLNHDTFDYCINCAAYTNVEQAEKTPEIAYQINAESVKNLAQVCAEKNIILIHISTDYVFDGNKNEPYIVDDKTNPINEYGKSKLLGEQFIQTVMNHYFIIRTSWLYSKKHGRNFYKTILNKAKTESTLFVTNIEIGCPTDTESLALYIIDLIKTNSKDYGIKHYCDSKPMTWYDFAKVILIENDLLSKIKLVKNNNYCTFATRPKYSVLKNS